MKKGVIKEIMETKPVRPEYQKVKTNTQHVLVIEMVVENDNITDAIESLDYLEEWGSACVVDRFLAAGDYEDVVKILHNRDIL